MKQLHSAQEPIQNSASDAAAGLIAGGFASHARAANRQFTLQPRFVGLIGGLLLLPAILWLRLGVGSRRGIERAWSDLPRSARVLPVVGLDHFAIVQRAGARSAPSERGAGRRCTADAHRTAIGEQERDRQEQNAFRNHRDLWKVT